MAGSSSKILVGVFGAPHGIHGEVRLKSYTADPAAIGSYGTLQDAGGARSFTLEALRPTVRALVDQHWLVNETAIGQMEEIARSTRTAMAVLWSIMLLFCAAAGLSLYAVHSLRARQKAAQIGMLRAMGISDALLRDVFLTEARLLWGRGTLYGLLLLALLVPLAMAVWFAPALVVFHDLPPVEALKQSFQGCLRNMVPFLVYGIIVLGLGILAAIPAFLGWLVLIPTLIGSTYYSYRDIFLDAM